MEKKNGFLNDENLPLCRFGPGGQYVTNWPGTAGNETSNASKRPISSVLNAISKMLDNVVSRELMQNSTVDKIYSAIQNSQLPDNLEYEIEFDKPNNINASSASGFEAGQQFQTQQMLFDNASGACQSFGHKPNNSVRAHHRPKRKRPAFGKPWQGSLFEPYQQSVKVA